MTESATYLNGEVAALRAAKAKAQETINRVDRALAILDGAPSPAPVVGVSGNAYPNLSGRQSRAVAEYMGGKTGKVVGARYGVHPITVSLWARKAGVSKHAR